MDKSPIKKTIATPKKTKIQEVKKDKIESKKHQSYEVIDPWIHIVA